MKKPSKKEMEEYSKRAFDKNIDAMKFCWSNNFYIYASAVPKSSNTAVLFKRKGRGIAVRVNSKMYNQKLYEHQVMMAHDIDLAYEQVYNKMKDKVNIKK